jgi:subtilisin family serine protease
MQTPSDRPDRAAGSDLVVDARWFHQVLQALGERQVLPSTLDVTACAELDLVLVRGLRLDAYAATARNRFATEVEALTTGSRPSGLDYLLYDLRRDFGDSTGAVPVLGKNRDAVLGYPQHKGIKYPEPEHDDVAPRGSAGEGVTVGIVDTAPASHPLLPPDLVDTDGWYTPDRDVSPWAGHGTFVAGLVRVEAPGARLRMRRGLSSESGRSTCWDVARAIAAFQGSGVAVLNLSFGCATPDRAAPLLLERALSRLDDDVLVVCAAGNRGLERKPPAYLWPGAWTTAVAVGTADAGGQVDDAFSLKRDWVDALAAGLGVSSAFLDADVTLADDSHPEEKPETKRFSGYARWSGTSFAAATVTGKVAARMSEDGVSARQAWDRLLADGQSSGVTKYRHQA